MNRGIPRAIEAALGVAGLVLAFPLVAAAALLVRVTSRGPAFFRQQRVGRGGRLFTLYKLRTMRSRSEGPQVTARGDDRVTPVGRFLRRSKLDEVPQLWNVVKGDMSLVGPRPEVPRYVDLADPLWERVLRVHPGITDPVTLRLRDEETLLAGVEGDPERFYRERLLPEKLHQYLAYLESRTAWTDVQVLYKTAWAVLFPGRGDAPDPPLPGACPLAHEQDMKSPRRAAPWAISLFCVKIAGCPRPWLGGEERAPESGAGPVSSLSRQATEPFFGREGLAEDGAARQPGLRVWAGTGRMRTTNVGMG